VVKGRARECVLLLAVIFITGSPSAFGTTTKVRKRMAYNIQSSFDQIQVVTTVQMVPPFSNSPCFLSFWAQINPRISRRLQADQDYDGVLSGEKWILGFREAGDQIFRIHRAIILTPDGMVMRRGPPLCVMLSHPGCCHHFFFRFANYSPSFSIVSVTVSSPGPIHKSLFGTRKSLLSRISDSNGEYFE
jgi:hypothetical protein